MVAHRRGEGGAQTGPRRGKENRIDKARGEERREEGEFLLLTSYRKKKKKINLP